jgi:hypothetical protein
LLYPPARHTRTDQLSILAGIVAGILLFTWLAHGQAGFRPEDAGLGKNTTSVLAEYDGRAIAAYTAQSEPMLESFTHLRKEGNRVALWLGASQLHAINQIQPDDHVAVHYASESATHRGSNLRYVQISAPNANLNELLAIYLQLRERNLVPDALVLSLTYDDLREPGVRPEVVAELPRELDLGLEHRGGLDNLVLARTQAARGARPAVNTQNVMEDTPQQLVESALTASLEQLWPPYAHRGQLTSWLEVNLLRLVYSLRSQATRQRIPPIPESEKQWNLLALDSLLEIAKRDGVAVLVYKAPHRPGMVPFYHDRASYDGFFEELSSELSRQDVHHADLETIVPAELWGETNDGNPDVFHFRGDGHRTLGARVDSELSKMGF